MIGDTFLPGEYFVYCCGSHWELGKVKRRCDDNPDFYFCYYTRGTTTARTCTTMMQKLANGDGGPANQYTLGDYAATRICDSILKVTNFFTDDPIWRGMAGDLPEELSYIPVEECGTDTEGSWATIC